MDNYQLNLKKEIITTIVVTVIFLLIGLFIEPIVHNIGLLFNLNVYDNPSLNTYLSVFTAFCGLTISMYFIIRSILEKNTEENNKSIEKSIDSSLDKTIFKYLLSDKSSEYDAITHIHIMSQLSKYMGLFRNESKYYLRCFSVLSNNAFIRLRDEMDDIRTKGIRIPIKDSPLIIERLLEGGNNYILIERENIIPRDDFSDGYVELLDKTISVNNKIKKTFILSPTKDDLIENLNLDKEISLTDLDKKITENPECILTAYATFIAEMKKWGFDTYFCCYSKLKFELNEDMIEETVEVYNNEVINISETAANTDDEGRTYRGGRLHINIKLLADTRKEQLFLNKIHQFKVKI